MGISGHSWLMPHADRRHVGRRQVRGGAMTLIVGFLIGTHQEERTEQEVLGISVRLRTSSACRPRCCSVRSPP